MRDGLKVFFTDHHFHLSDLLHDDEFLIRLSATIVNVRDKIVAVIKKLELFSVCIKDRGLYNIV